MSLVHVLVTKLRGYDMCTLYFDESELKEMNDEEAFCHFEKEFISNKGYFQTHPEDTFGQTYFGYFIFPYFGADEIHDLYKMRCESHPNLKKRYNIYFTKEYSHLEDMIKKFDRPLSTFMKEKFIMKSYSHRLEYFERSIQILRDMQTAIYETETKLAERELEFHKKFLEKSKGKYLID